jgi:acyl dehydratase
VVGHAILKSVFGYDPMNFVTMSGRFSAPVFPGETIRTEIWRDGNVVSFRALVPARNVVAMSNGRAEIKA